MNLNFREGIKICIVLGGFFSSAFITAAVGIFIKSNILIQFSPIVWCVLGVLIIWKVNKIADWVIKNPDGVV